MKAALSVCAADRFTFPSCNAHTNMHLIQAKRGYLVLVLLTLHTVMINTRKMEMWFVVGVDLASN